MDPVRVSGWFRPPAQPVLAPTGNLYISQLSKFTQILTTPPRPRNLQHLDRRLATHHPVPAAPHLQQRRPPPGLAANRANPRGQETLRQTCDSSDDVPPCDDGVWRVHALGAAEPSHEGDGYWGVWECGVDGVGGGGVDVGDGGGGG